MATWLISGTLGFITGGVVIWFTKDAIQKLFLGAEAFAARLRARAEAVRSALK